MTDLERTQDALAKTRSIAWQACGALQGVSLDQRPPDRVRIQALASRWTVLLAEIEAALVASEKQT